MNDEQRCMTPFRAKPFGTDHFPVLLRYGSLMCNKHIAFTMPCRLEKMTSSLRPNLVLTGPML